MPRKREVPKRHVIPDPKYRDQTLAKFIQNLMLGGKKSTAEKIVYGTLDIVAAKTKDDPLQVMKKALDNVKPILEVRSRRVGGATYQIPTEVRPERKMALAMRWIIRSAKVRSEKTMRERLAGEVLDAFNQRGAAFKKREDVHRMAEANKAFAHYRW